LIDIDIPGRTIHVALSEAELSSRLKGFRPPERTVPAGFMRRYVKYVGSAGKGAVMD